MNGNTQGEEEDDGGWGDDYTDPAVGECLMRESEN